jgi:hypothetical protein
MMWNHEFFFIFVNTNSHFLVGFILH